MHLHLRKLLPSAIALAMILGLASPPAMADPWADDCSSCFYVNLEPLWMRAASSEADAIWLTLDTQNTLGQPGDDGTVDNTGAFHMDSTFGARGTLGYQFTDKWGAEIVGTWIDGWSDVVSFSHAEAEAHVGDTGRMMVPFQSTFTGIADSAFTDIDLAEAKRATKFGTWELNAVRRMSDHISVLIGARRFDFKDDFKLMTTRGSDSGYYDIKARNRAYGVQFGADAVFPLSDRFAISGFIKTGMFLNDVTVRNNVIDGDLAALAGSTAFRMVEDDDSRAAFIADTGVYLDFAISDRIVTSFGFQVMAISGLAMVGDNLEFRTGDFDVEIFEAHQGQAKRLSVPQRLQFQA